MDIHHSDRLGTSHGAAPDGVTVAVARCDADRRGTRSAAPHHPNRPRHDTVCRRAGSPYSAAVRWQPRYTPWLYLLFSTTAWATYQAIRARKRARVLWRSV